MDCRGRYRGQDGNDLVRALLLVLAAACSVDTGPATSIATSAVVGGCVDPTTFGAQPLVPGLAPTDSRPAIQQAVDVVDAGGGGRVCLGEGSWYVTRAPAGSYNRFAAISTHGTNVEISGVSRDQTRLVAFGDAGASAFFVISVDPGATNTTIRDLTIDTTGLVNTDAGEQTHAIAIGTSVCAGALCQQPIANTTVQRVAFLHDGPPGERWGDCIRVAGNAPEIAAVNTKLLDLDLLLCGRSGVAMQRNANYLQVSRSYFAGDAIGGGMVDGEATGGQGSRGLVVSGNMFVRFAPGGDNFAVAMTSQDDFAVHDNVFIGRGATCVRCANGSIHHNVFSTTDVVATLGVIDLANKQDRISVDHNKIIRRGGAGPCIKVVPHAGVFPGPVSVDANHCTNETEGAAILLDSVQDASVHANNLVGNGTAASTGVYVQGSRPIENLVIAGNRIRGMTFGGVRLVSSASSTYAAATVYGNVSRSSGPGLRCDNPQFLPAGGVVVGLNNWSTPATCTPP